ncbi:D-alanine--D-alanine ligase [Bacteroidota bacterium]
MKKNIAIVTGGDSSELVISLKSADQVRLHIDPVKYEPYIVYVREDDWHVRPGTGGEERIPVNRKDFSFELEGNRIRFDYAFIALHGPPGEDGQLQAYLDKLGIPYSTSGARSLELSFNKYACKEFLSKSEILTADAILIRKDPNAKKQDKLYEPGQVLEKVGLPCFIKPNAGGSSFGVSRINHAGELDAAIQKALKEDDEVLIETFIPGTELTCGVLKTPSREFIFPVTEVISKNEFFDYEAKYTEGMAREVTPAEIPGELARRCQSISSKIYDLLDCRGLVRIDFINRDGELYFLELNGVPGMSRESIIPKQIRTLGHTESEIYNLIIEETAGW